MLTTFVLKYFKTLIIDCCIFIKKTTYNILITIISIKTYSKITLPGNLYIRNLFILFILDCLIMDDEPLWEPLE